MAQSVPLIRHAIHFARLLECWIFINLIKTCSKVVLIKMFAELNSTQNVRHHEFFILIRLTTFSISRLCSTNKRFMKLLLSGCARFPSWIGCHFTIESRVWDRFKTICVMLLCFRLIHIQNIVFLFYPFEFNFLFYNITAFSMQQFSSKNVCSFPELPSLNRTILSQRVDNLVSL